MQRIDGRIIFSASDLNDFVECRALGGLERALIDGLRAPPPADDEATRLLARKGDEHERRYLDRLRERGVEVLELAAPRARTLDALVAAEAQTLAAMERGVACVYQPTFFDGAFLGRADFLRRVEYPSERWPWSYEVVDTKLARSTKAYFLVQLCAYSEHLSRVQGAPPRAMHVALGNGAERSFQLDAYVAYYRRLKANFLASISCEPTYPHECAHCAICRWSSVCDARRRADDHLSLVAWMRRDQLDRLTTAGIATLTALAGASDDARPFGMRVETFTNLRLQAQLQCAQRDAIARGAPEAQRYHYRLMPHEPDAGFALLPAPDAGDVYFDIEGDPFYSPDGGLEYLFGLYYAHEDRYRSFWARSAADERVAVEALLDALTARRAAYPNAHVYHYASYERAALGRLTGRHNTRIDAFDDLLRSEGFVDLFTVVRQGLRISQERYSIKKLEPFYGMRRSTTLRRGDDSILLFERWLDDGDDTLLDEIERYNEDDCRSTFLLHRWLLERRDELIASEHVDLAWRPAPEAPSTAPEEREAQERRARLADELIARGTASADEARVLLGHLVGYHRREAKPAWWEFFSRCENRDRLIEFDHESIGGLRLCEEVPPSKQGRSFVYTYAFPEQQHHLGASPVDPATRKGAGEILAIDDVAHRLQIKLSSKIIPNELHALIPGKPYNTVVLERALGYVGELELAGGLQREHPVVTDLLRAAPPRLRNRPHRERVQPDHLDGMTLARMIAALDQSYLVVQGPPGSGKSTLGGEAIAHVLADGLRVAVLTRTHKAAHNFVHAVEQAAQRHGITFRGAHKGEDDDAFVSRLRHAYVCAAAKNEDALDRAHALVSGTPWLFASEAARGAFDVMVVDEAGQLALADVIAAAPAARSLVLLGDPLQLAQVTRGAHPPGVGGSVLAHALGDATTIAPERGIFLDRSWRMHPDICRFISHTVYDGRLRSAEGLEANAIASAGLHGNGLRWLPVEHRDNRRASIEEADAIVREITALLAGTVTLAATGSRPLCADDVLVVSPYNAQRALIASRLRDAHLDVRVGTVDKFQGQEAPVVFYSMATSSGDDIPRDVEFLFEKNRFNVAVSRAQCLSVLVCSPRLLDVRCTTPEQMSLVNLLCAYVDLARPHGDETPAGTLA